MSLRNNFDIMHTMTEQKAYKYSYRTANRLPAQIFKVEYEVEAPIMLVLSEAETFLIHIQNQTAPWVRTINR